MMVCNIKYEYKDGKTYIELWGNLRDYWIDLDFIYWKSLCPLFLRFFRYLSL